LTLKGNAEGSFKLKQAGGKATGNLLLRLPNSYLVMIDEDGAATRFEYQNAFVRASINNKTVIANAKMQLNGRGNFSADANIILGADNESHRIQGKAALDIPNIRWMQSFSPQTTHLQGRVTSRVTFKGLLMAPKITGQIALQDASLKLPKVGTHLRHINLSIKANDANRAIISGSLVSGQGKVALSGFVLLKDLKKLNAEIKLKGTNFQFINTHEAKAVMNPDVTIKVTPKTVDITGKIHIPTATIVFNAIPESNIDESEDVIVMGEKKADGSFSAIKTHPNLVVSLGKKVKFQGFGLDTKLGGSVRVIHDNQSILTQGSIKINEGRYQAYGQNLIINDGRLVFNGPPTNVGMDVKAIREIEDSSISVGIHLTGTLQKPKTALFSSPTLSESNILSYLLTGQSLGDITGSQTALLMQAVRSLNVSGGDGLVRNIGNSLGLDDLSIVPKDDLSKSELRLGKKLGSKLYVRYIVGIFDSMQKVALEYKVNKYLNLEAQIGRDDGKNIQSLDLIYQVETN
jgi:translocation and assembly module TamB